MRKAAISASAIVICLTALVAEPVRAQTACPAPGYTKSFADMVREETTFDRFYHRMVVGRVVAIRDRGPKGGHATAVLAVAAHPTGFVPLAARVHFDRPGSGTYSEDSFVFKIGQRWVLIARHLHSDGSYRPDGPCGRSRVVRPEKFQTLVALARRVG